MVGISSIVWGGQPWLLRPASSQQQPAPPLGKLNHKVELLCFADKTIIQTDSLHFIKISLTIFLHEFWFCSDLFYLSEKPLIYSCMLVHCTPAAAATPTNTWSLTVTTPLRTSSVWIKNIFVPHCRCYLFFEARNLQFFGAPSNFLIVSLSLFERKIKM